MWAAAVRVWETMQGMEAGAGSTAVAPSPRSAVSSHKERVPVGSFLGRKIVLLVLGS